MIISTRIVLIVSAIIIAILLFTIAWQWAAAFLVAAAARWYFGYVEMLRQDAMRKEEQDLITQWNQAIKGIQDFGTEDAADFPEPSKKDPFWRN